MYNRNSKRKKKTKIAIAVLLLIVFAAGLCVYIAPYAADRYGFHQQDVKYTLEVTQENKNNVPSILCEGGVIRSEKLFKRFMDKTYGSNFAYQPGIYYLNYNMSFEELGSKLQKPDSEKIKISVPEGVCCNDIANLLAEKGLCERSEFVDALSDEYNYEFLKYINNADLRPYKLEGYLAPLTYDIEKGSTAHEIVNMMLAPTADIFDDDFLNKCKKMNISPDEALTMASIIEKECSGYPDEMENVSAVFWNRFYNPEKQNTPNLGSDPTVKYADLLEEQGYEKKIWKGYTTYSCKGLPTGPICSPGTEAINAAVNPADHEYYFFFTDRDSKFYYFETNAEFEAAWDKLGH